MGVTRALKTRDVAPVWIGAAEIRNASRSGNCRHVHVSRKDDVKCAQVQITDGHYSIARQLAFDLQICLLAVTRFDIRIDPRDIWFRWQCRWLKYQNIRKSRRARLRRR